MAASVRVLKFTDRPSHVPHDGCLVAAIASAAASANSRQGAWSLQVVTLDAGAHWVADRRSLVAVLDGAVAGSRPGGMVTLAAGAGLEASTPSRVVALSLDPTLALGTLEPATAGTHDLVGLSWFVVACEDLTLRINDGEPVTLAAADTARITLRAQPISRLTLEARGAGGLPAARENAPVAVLASVGR